MQSNKLFDQHSRAASMNRTKKEEVYDCSTNDKESFLEHGCRISSINTIFQNFDSPTVKLCALVDIMDEKGQVLRKELLSTAYLKRKFPQELIKFYESKIHVYDGKKV